MSWVVPLLVLPVFFFFLFGSKYWSKIDDHFNKPLIAYNEARENDPVYQHSYCRKGHPEHPCGLWLCPHCSLCLTFQAIENRNQFHGGQYSETRRK